MSDSERAQALHYRQQVEALFDDYAPDFEALPPRRQVAGPSRPAGRSADAHRSSRRPLAVISVALAWWRPPWPSLAAISPTQASLLSLGYDIPAEIVHELQRDGAADAAVATSAISHTVAVDLGCGTGLAGAAMKPFCKGTLLGCDLSGGKIRLAKKKRGPNEERIYDKLETVDAVAFLHRSLEPASADLIVAADVTVYMRSLEGLMQGAARCRNQGPYVRPAPPKRLSGRGSG